MSLEEKANPYIGVVTGRKVCLHLWCNSRRAYESILCNVQGLEGHITQGAVHTLQGSRVCIKQNSRVYCEGLWRAYSADLAVCVAQGAGASIAQTVGSGVNIAQE